MNVHVVQYNYRDGDYEGNDIIGVYADKDKAWTSMTEHMAQVKFRNIEYYGDRFESDFEIDWPDMVQFGFYGRGFEGDHIWSCKIDTMELE